MAVAYKYNPFVINARIYEIVCHVVFANKDWEINIEEALEGGHASAEEDEWDTLHEENPEFFLEVIQGDLSGARLALEKARESGAQSAKLSNLQDEVTRLEEVLRKAIDLAHELEVEASVLRSNNNESKSGLRLTSNSMPESTTPQFLLHTVYTWLIDQHGIEVREWARPGTVSPRRERKYTTRLLNVLDAAIEEFYEDYDPKRPHKNAVVEKWMNDTFPEHEGLLSQKVIEAMCKIMKPGEP